MCLFAYMLYDISSVLVKVIKPWIKTRTTEILNCESKLIIQAFRFLEKKKRYNKKRRADRSENKLRLQLQASDGN